MDRCFESRGIGYQHEPYQCRAITMSITSTTIAMTSHPAMRANHRPVAASHPHSHLNTAAGKTPPSWRWPGAVPDRPERQSCRMRYFREGLLSAPLRYTRRRRHTHTQRPPGISSLLTETRPHDATTASQAPDRPSRQERESAYLGIALFGCPVCPVCGLSLVLGHTHSHTGWAIAVSTHLVF